MEEATSEQNGKFKASIYKMQKGNAYIVPCPLIYLSRVSETDEESEAQGIRGERGRGVDGGSCILLRFAPAKTWKGSRRPPAEATTAPTIPTNQDNAEQLSTLAICSGKNRRIRITRRF